MKLGEIHRLPIFKSLPSLGIFGNIGRDRLMGKFEPNKYKPGHASALGHGQDVSSLIQRTVDILAKQHRLYTGDRHTFFRSYAQNDLENAFRYAQFNKKSEILKLFKKSYKLSKNTERLIKDIIKNSKF